MLQNYWKEIWQIVVEGINDSNSEVNIESYNVIKSIRIIASRNESELSAEAKKTAADQLRTIVTSLSLAMSRLTDVNCYHESFFNVACDCLEIVNSLPVRRETCSDFVLPLMRYFHFVLPCLLEKFSSATDCNLVHQFLKNVNAFLKGCLISSSFCGVNESLAEFLQYSVDSHASILNWCISIATNAIVNSDIEQELFEIGISFWSSIDKSLDCIVNESEKVRYESIIWHWFLFGCDTNLRSVLLCLKFVKTFGQADQLSTHSLNLVTDDLVYNKPKKVRLYKLDATQLILDKIVEKCGIFQSDFCLANSELEKLIFSQLVFACSSVPHITLSLYALAGARAFDKLRFNFYVDLISTFASQISSLVISGSSQIKLERDEKPVKISNKIPTFSIGKPKTTSKPSVTLTHPVRALLHLIENYLQLTIAFVLLLSFDG
jgi:hypothetical protein